MSGPLSSVLGGNLQAPVQCSSSWLCQADLAAVLIVSAPDTAALDEAAAATRENLILLDPPSPSQVDTPCSLSLCCVAQGKDRILNVSICSEARTIEVYSGSQDGQEDEYLGTSRGEKFCTLASSGEDSPVTLYKAQLKLDFPVPSCKVKLLSLGGKHSVSVSEICVQVTSVPERCSQASSVLGPSINLERVQSIMDSMGGKMSPGAEELMTMMRAQQKHQAPFSAHLLQLFGSFAPGRDQKKEDVGQHAPQSSQAPDTREETAQNQASTPHTSFQQLSSSQSDLGSIMSSVLQAQMGQTPNCHSPDSLLPLLRNLCGEKKPRGEIRQESCSAPREEKVDPALEKLLSVHMERMERTLLDHIDHRMKTLQEHLDARLDRLMNLVESSSSSESSSRNTAEKMVNGQLEHRHEQDWDMH
ncbi:ATPase PAAT [Pseudophryne corroboree]|uniref:ATPase PAAT n=1 Tax=Pseudophryne corroboree TaxID=495146 RepID=UPI003081E9C1